MTWFFLATTVIFFIISTFLGSEMVKKFKFMSFFAKSNKTTTVSYHFGGAKKLGLKKGMRKIAIYWDRPFTALIGFDLTLPISGTGFDYYGVVEAKKGNDGRYIAVISTYLGNGPALFKFLINREAYAGEMIPTCFADDAEQDLEPDEVYPPHWFQKLGFFG